MASAPDTPEPPPFFPVNLQDAQRRAIEADTLGYQLSDQDFARRFPGLVSGRQTQLNDAYRSLTGPLDPALQNQFATTGIERALSVTGQGSSLAGLGTPGSASRNILATSVATDTMKEQDKSRDYFQSLMESTPQRNFGIDPTNLAIGNVVGQNALQQAQYTGQVQAGNAQQAASDQNTAAAISTAIAIAGIAATAG